MRFQENFLTRFVNSTSSLISLTAVLDPSIAFLMNSGLVFTGKIDATKLEDSTGFSLNFLKPSSYASIKSLLADSVTLETQLPRFQ